MNDTVLEHPLVREYLRELNRASVTLPAAQARELRDQIAAHLAEALPPRAADEQVLSVRRVHVSWTSDECFGAEGGIIIDQITLLVRVGVVTRTESVKLQQAFELAGPKHSIDHNCA
ncbi:MAG TPA: hypothetical protein VMI73_29725 [Trebonia sp.]|nr:hypothetical protein [Trebonia sp.]